MKRTPVKVSTCLFLILLSVVAFQISGKTSEVRAAEGRDQPGSQAQRPHGDNANLPNGVIGVSLHVGGSVSAIPHRCTWPMCIRRVRPSKQASSTEMRW